MSQNNQPIQRYYGDFKVILIDGEDGLSDGRHDDSDVITSVVRPYSYGTNSNGDVVEDNEYILHAPIFEVNVPCAVVPSEKPGHYNIIIDKYMIWNDYDALLFSLCTMGFIDNDYYGNVINAGMSYASIPEDENNIKPAEVPLDQTKEIARLIYEKFKLEKALRELANQKSGNVVSRFTRNILYKYKDKSRDDIDDTEPVDIITTAYGFLALDNAPIKQDIDSDWNQYWEFEDDVVQMDLF